MKEHRKIITVVFALCLAMAALEAAVVVYLRALYYPEGFSVAMKLIDEKILLVEIFREAATVIMLVSIGYLAGKNFRERVAYFLVSFAIWDIFYYVWLKLFIDWPTSIFEWDILFLIPFTWLGPVLAPVICSCTMIGLFVYLIKSKEDISRTTWACWIIGSTIILYTFLIDYGTILIRNGFISDYANVMKNPAFLQIASSYLPANYNWSLFWIGEITIISGVVWKRALRSRAARSLSVVRN